MLFSHILRYPLWHESHIFVAFVAQQPLSDFVLGLWTSSDVFCSFRRLIFATGRRLLRGKLCDGLRTFAAWKHKRMRRR